MTLLINPQGCAARFGRSVEVGTVVRLDGLSRKCRQVNGRDSDEGIPDWKIKLHAADVRFDIDDDRRLTCGSCAVVRDRAPSAVGMLSFVLSTERTVRLELAT
jgi:hypothetical protein